MAAVCLEVSATATCSGMAETECLGSKEMAVSSDAAPFVVLVEVVVLG